MRTQTEFLKFAEKVQQGYRCAIVSAGSRRDLEMVESLYEEARKDYPHINRSRTEVVIYNDRSLNGRMGLEFNLPAEEPLPEGYSVMTHMPFTY